MEVNVNFLLSFIWERDEEDASDAPFTQWELGLDDEQIQSS